MTPGYIESPEFKGSPFYSVWAAGKQDTPVPTDAPSSGSSNVGLIVGILLAVLAVCAAVSAFAYRRKQHSGDARTSTKGKRIKTYEYGLGDADFQDMELELDGGSGDYNVLDEGTSNSPATAAPLTAANLNKAESQSKKVYDFDSPPANDEPEAKPKKKRGKADTSSSPKRKGKKTTSTPGKQEPEHEPDLDEEDPQDAAD